jgi:hypothetical protein
MSHTAIAMPHPQTDSARYRPPIAVVAVIVLCLLVIVRGPFWTIDRPDDAFFSEVALMWRQGWMPYVHAFDVKPPGFFAALSLAQTIVGPTRMALRLVGGLSDALTMILLLHFAWRKGVPEAGILAAALFAWGMNVLIADDCYSLLIALTTLAMMCAMAEISLPRRAIAAGLAIGAAGVVKQTAAFEAVAILLLLIRQAPDRATRLKAGALYAASALVPVSLVVAYFAFKDALYPLMVDTVVIALQRPGASSDNVTFIEGIGRFLLNGLILTPLVVVAATVAVIPSRFPRFREDICALRYWFVASIASVIVQRALLPSYLALVLPSAGLLMGLGLASRLEQRPDIARRGVAAIVATLAIMSLIRFCATHPEDLSSIERAAAAIHAADPRPDDRLYVIGTNVRSTWLYVETGLRPPLPFIIPSQQACPFPNVGPRRIDEAFAARPRFVITEAEYKVYGCETDNVGARIRSLLDTGGYRIVARIGETAERYSLYERAEIRAP